MTIMQWATEHWIVTALVLLILASGIANAMGRR